MTEPASTGSRNAAPSHAPVRKFLVVVDKTAECKVALRFAARRAEHTRGRVTLLCVVQPGDFQHWAGVASIMRDEAHQEAESLLHNAARVVNELTGVIPELVVREGRVQEEIMGLIGEDPDISILVLGAATSKEGPGPLVSRLAGPSAYPIPVTIVPGGLSEDQIDALA